MYQREIQNIIDEELSEKEILIIYGARQIGKTTLIKKLLESRKSIVLNCESPSISEIIESRNISRIKELIGENDFVAFDEAQKVPLIGETLKLLYDDESVKYKIIVTGSSSLELAGKITEPLTGRNRKLILYPISLREIKNKEGWIWVEENLENLLIYGQYPGILTAREGRKQILLEELTSDYLYRDILSIEQLKNPSLLRKLLKALALQIGNQVSSNELAGLLGVSSRTIEKYLDLLEKCFVIYSLGTYSSNLRNEIKKGRKYYFVDLGIRNAVINNFNTLVQRQDIGQLWENFCINERIKHNSYNNIRVNYYFWRTYDGAELDLIEESGGKLLLSEFKWNENRKAKVPLSFIQKYGENDFTVIGRQNAYNLIEN